MITLPVSPGPALRVLVVDDDQATQDLLRDFLVSEGYDHESALRGETALDSVRSSPPDIVLLDVAMPGMDGIEVCRELHNNPKTAHIPVILMTALRRREKRLDGISAGARDFLLKPLDLADLRIRVRNAGEMKRLFDQSQEQLRTITELETHRDSLVQMVVHDLKSPLTAVMGNLELMGLFLPQDIGSEILEALAGCQSGARKMNEMVSSILSVSKLESGTIELNLEDISMAKVAEDAIKQLGPRSSRVRLLAQEGQSGGNVNIDVNLIQRVILNLLMNALDHSAHAEPVVVTIDHVDGATQLTVVDRGPGVPEDFRDKIFEKFKQVSDRMRIRKGSVGLGLAFCKLAVEAHSGEIGIDSPDDGGSAFWFRLPAGGPPGSASPRPPLSA